MALLDYLFATMACTYGLLCEISPWLGQWAKVSLSSSLLILMFTGYLFT